MTDIYIAGSYKDRAKLKRRAVWLMDQGINVTSTWLTGWHRPEHSWAAHDLQEMTACKALVVDASSKSTSGGYMLEMGFAAGLRKKMCVVVPNAISDSAPIVKWATACKADMVGSWELVPAWWWEINTQTGPRLGQVENTPWVDDD